MIIVYWFNHYQKAGHFYYLLFPVLEKISRKVFGEVLQSRISSSSVSGKLERRPHFSITYLIYAVDGFIMTLAISVNFQRRGLRRSTHHQNFQTFQFYQRKTIKSWRLRMNDVLLIDFEQILTYSCPNKNKLQSLCENLQQI